MCLNLLLRTYVQGGNSVGKPGEIEIVDKIKIALQVEQEVPTYRPWNHPVSHWKKNIHLHKPFNLTFKYLHKKDNTKKMTMGYKIIFYLFWWPNDVV